jgi:hypothetical protein
MAKEGKRGRKVGRSKARHPSAMRYTREKRWETNKAKRVKRHAKRMAKKAAHRQDWLDRKSVS